MAGDLLLAEAHEQLGQFDAAMQTLLPWRARISEQSLTTAPEATAAAQVLLRLARYQGRPAQDYHVAIGLLSKAHQELDRLYWPAHLAQAQLLFEKDNSQQAFAALMDTLRLNPRCPQAWYLLGLITTEGYSFDEAAQCLEQLRSDHSPNLLADLLEVQLRLQQKDAAGARAALAPALERFPEQRMLLALHAAVEAMSFEPKAYEAAIARFAAVAPGHPLAYVQAGKYLSLARQYGDAEAALEAAIAQQPNWPEAHVELGLLLMQSGNEPKALTALRRASQLDPFNRRAANQLQLVDHLLQYATIETEHFTVKYKPGIDEVLARDMPDELEEIYRDITSVFAHKPRRKTLIEIMPDEKWFGVRITGIPEIWTIAASTGDIIALTPPRVGAKQRGMYDWARVIRHEFVHTVTLDKTANRLPHWFTEACAVSQEPGGRDYPTCQLLAEALAKNALFNLDTINWAFVRPRAPHERPLAYAQAHWMLQYITETFGHDAVLALLRSYRQGLSDPEAFAKVTGQNPDAFMQGFLAWAGKQVQSWGLSTPVKDERIDKLLKGEGDAAALDELLTSYPNHPDLLRLAAQRAAEGSDPQLTRQLVQRYAAARPIDPWPYEVLWALAMAENHTADAIGPLHQLDSQEQQHGSWAQQLAEICRAAGQLDQARSAARRALHREPYNPKYRELMATIEMQRQDMKSALRHVQALTVLEPHQAVHFVRLAALQSRLGDADAADTAARKARELDPKANVERFLKSEDFGAEI
jgi:predicted Zn-dependent protease